MSHALRVLAVKSKEIRTAAVNNRLRIPMALNLRQNTDAPESDHGRMIGENICEVNRRRRSRRGIRKYFPQSSVFFRPERVSWGSPRFAWRELEDFPVRRSRRSLFRVVSKRWVQTLSVSLMPGLESFDNLNGFRAQVFDAAVWCTLVQSDMRVFRDRHLMALEHVLESCTRPQ